MNRIAVVLAAQLLVGVWPPSVQGRALNDEYPVAAEVRELERQVIELAPDAARRQQLEALREAWLRTRAEQCLAAADPRDRNAIELCASGADQDRAQSLRRTKLLLLVEAAPKPAPTQLAQVTIAAAIDPGSGVRAMEVTPSGARALIVGVSKLLAVDTLTGITLHAAPAPNYENAHLSVFRNGRVAVTTDQHVRGMRFWDSETGDALREFPDAAGPHRIMPDGRRIAYAQGDKLLVYDVFANRAVSGPASHNGEAVARIAVSDDGKQIATLTIAGTLTLWSVLVSEADGSYVLSRVAGASTRIDNAGAQALEFSRAGDAVWTASNAALVRWARPAAAAADAAGVTAQPGLAAAETVRTGTTQGQRLRRIPGTDVLVVPGNDRQRGSYLIFYDATRKSAALVDVQRNYYPYIALSADGRFLFTATVRELRRVDIPAPGQFAEASKVLAAVQPPPPALSLAPGGPILKDLPAQPLVEVIGVYEGGGARVQSVQTSSGLRAARSITVGVGRTERPLVLVLASYEPVIWELEVAKNAQLVRVLVSGTYESLVRGAQKVEVTRIGTASSHVFGDVGFARLRAEILQYTGRGVDGYQGSYRGIRFSVGAGAPKEAARVPQGLGLNMPALLQEADTQQTSRWTTSAARSRGYGVMPSGQAPPGASDGVREFAQKLYEVSVYTSEEAALATLVDAEQELVASRWLAQKLVASGGRAPAGAPGGWEAMVRQLREALAPIAKRHSLERAKALRAAGLEGSAPFVNDYERLVRARKNRGNIQLSSGETLGAGETEQSEAIPEILAFHQSAAAVKWRKLWPELRARAARLAALHYRVDADPALGGGDWYERARRLVRRTGGRVLTPVEWREMTRGRLGFTLSGLDRFLLPLGTEMREAGGTGVVTSIQESGQDVVIAEREGAGLAFRILDAHWERDIGGALSPAELRKIDEALTASYVPRKRRWFAPLELEWDAYLDVSRQLRTARPLQQVYQSFARDSDAAMGRVWARWKQG